MEDEVVDMVSSGIETVKFIIEHKRQPDERMPQVIVFCAESPADALRCDAGLDIVVFGDIHVIIEIDKIKLMHLPVDGKNSHSQDDVNDQLFSVFIHMYSVILSF